MGQMYTNSLYIFQLSRYPLIHYSFDSTKKNIKAMDSLISECDDTELTQRQCFPYGPAYLGHEGDRVSTILYLVISLLHLLLSSWIRPRLLLNL